MVLEVARAYEKVSMKDHKFTLYKSLQVPTDKPSIDYITPSWWELPSVILFYFGQKMLFWGIVAFLIMWLLP